MWAPILMAIPVAAVLSTDPTWLPWFGVKTPDTGLVPNVQALFTYGLAFGLGWLVQRQAGLLDVWRRRWPFHILLAVLATGGCLYMAGLTPTLEKLEPAELTWGYALSYAMALWCWTFGLIGAGLALMSGHSPARRYLADASYWIYIVHLPVVMALGVLVAPLDWAWPAKYGVILGGTLAAALVTYQLLVRHSFIGGILNGKRPAKKAKGQAEADVPAYQSET